MPKQLFKKFRCERIFLILMMSVSNNLLSSCTTAKYASKMEKEPLETKENMIAIWNNFIMVTYKTQQVTDFGK